MEPEFLEIFTPFQSKQGNKKDKKKQETGNKKNVRNDFNNSSLNETLSIMRNDFRWMIEKKESTDQIQETSDNVKNENNTVHIDVLRFALGNDIIMENIVNSMDHEDLDSWYEFCEKFELYDGYVLCKMLTHKSTWMTLFLLATPFPISSFSETHTYALNNLKNVLY